jgi:hypothetical protein
MKTGLVVPIYKEEIALQLMNLFSGNKFKDSINEMFVTN